MEDKFLGKKRCFDFAFESKTETEPEEDVIRGVIPEKFRLFGVDIVIQPTIKQTIKQEFPDHGENTNPTIALLDYIKSTLGDDLEISDVQILIQKKLERSDMKSHQSRLSIPAKMIKNTDFLTDSEKGWLEGYKSRPVGKKVKIEKNKLSVKVFGSSLLPEHDLDLTRWDYAKNKNGEKRGGRYVLNNGWNEFRKENGLEEGQKIQVLSFRHKGRLCFAIVSLEKEKEEVIKEKKVKKKKIRPIQSYAAALSWKKSGRPRSCRILL